MTQCFATQISGVVERGAALFRALDGKPMLLTGCTGFFGRWLLESLVAAQTHLPIRLDVLVITRDSEAFRRRAAHLAAAPGIRLRQSDICALQLSAPRFAYIIHGAATSAQETFAGEAPLRKFLTAYEGTKRVLDIAVEAAAERVLMVGSGSVYGGLSTQLGPVSEDHPGAPLTLDTEAALGHGKRAAEFLCACYVDRVGVPVTIARCFSFVGAFLPLDIHYAIGNFLHQALTEDAITVRGDGMPLRSYLFAGDLVIWLLTLLLRGEPRQVYNVGSDQMIALGDLARLVRDQLAPKKPVHILGQGAAGPRSCYVPNIDRARSHLGVDVWTPLTAAIQLTAAAVRQNG